MPEVERRRPRTDAPERRPRPEGATDLREVRAKLRIDDDDLDTCLVEQPEYYYVAAMASTAANAVRDGLELELKEKVAELDRDIRVRLSEANEKLTETGLANEIATLPVIKELKRKILDARRKADEATALKESYVQRSYALKDLNAIQLARFYNLGVERGATSQRREVGERLEQQANDARDRRNRSMR